MIQTKEGGGRESVCVCVCVRARACALDCQHSATLSLCVCERERECVCVSSILPLMALGIRVWGLGEGKLPSMVSL
jgi:hypothetical protein